MKFPSIKKINKLFIYELSLLVFALLVVAFDFVYIMGNPKAKPLHVAQHASAVSLSANNESFRESCQVLDSRSEDLKSMIQRGICNVSVK